MSDFIINKNNNGYRLIINDSLKDPLIEELKPFAKLHRVEMHDCKKVVVGKISLKGDLEYPYSSNQDIEAGISLENKDYEHKNLISYENWHAANKILGNFFLQPEDVGKYRPLEINYDNLRVSFDKGCYRGQEIVARMKYLGINRRKFCTLVVNNSFELNQKIKIIGKIIKFDKLKIFNAIIKRDEIDQVKRSRDIIELI
jgi:folate-binding protein YgfZ